MCDTFISMYIKNFRLGLQLVTILDLPNRMKISDTY